MSREQWGHGYHQGVLDALTGKFEPVINVKYTSLKAVFHMVASNGEKICDKTKFPVSEFIAMCHFGGMEDDLIKAIYDYIRRKKPLGCYVSGIEKNWKKDMFILPDIDVQSAIWYIESSSLLDIV